jgi:hypothetical protein
MTKIFLYVTCVIDTHSKHLTFITSVDSVTDIEKNSKYTCL